jgi:hypothetical protein
MSRSSQHYRYRPSPADGSSTACTAQRGLIKACTTSSDRLQLELVVLPAVHASRKMTLSYYWEGARPTEATEGKLSVGQVVEFNAVAAVEHHERGIHAVITDTSTLLVLKRKQAEAFVLSLVA